VMKRGSRSLGRIMVAPFLLHLPNGLRYRRLGRNRLLRRPNMKAISGARH
jgi:hypothetical protein